MVLKKRKVVKVGAIVLASENLEKLKALDGGPLAQQLASVLKECVQLNDGVQQIQLIKKMGSLFEEMDEKETESLLLHGCLEALALIYFSLDSKNPLKRALASALSAVPGRLQGGAVEILSVCLQERLGAEGPVLYRAVTDCVTGCLESFSLGERCIQSLLIEVFQFLQKALTSYHEQNSSLHGNHIAQTQLMQDCLAAVKASMVVVQRSQERICGALQAQHGSLLWDTMSGLLRCFTGILIDGDFLQTVQSTSGMAVVLFIRTMLEHEDHLASLVDDLLAGAEESLSAAPQWLSGSCAELYSRERPAPVALFLCHGALAMLSWRSGELGGRGEELLRHIPAVLLELNSQLKESSMAMSVSRILHLWTCAALDGLECGSCSPSLRGSLSGDSPLLHALLEYVYAHWEHPLDGVRHQTKAVFRNLLRMQRTATGITHASEDPFFTSLTQNLLALEWHSKGKYASLSCLVEYLGAESLLAADAHIPAQLLSLMGDQSLAPYASDLLETLFESHRTQLSSSPRQGCSWLEQWHCVWVSPLLAALCEGQLDQTTYITDYCLPKLLKCSPESLSHMVRVLQSSEQDRIRGLGSSRGALGALMTCLRAARAQGVLRITQEGVWGGGLVPLALLKQALVHKHDQVRVDALGLICESHRSTEMLSAQEMELMHHFLPNNLNTQSPGVRQQTLSLLRKLFCRIRDSTQLLQKRSEQRNPQLEEGAEGQDLLCTLQHYKEFMCWVCETLFQALFPGASFPTRFSALNLLGLVADTFTFSTQAGPGHSLFQLGETLTAARVQAVLECITSGFEEIKSLAFNLLRKLPPSALGFQDTAHVKGLLQAALTLSTSTKPYDCVSASYLLNLLVHQGALLRALQLCAEEQRVDLSVGECGQEGEAVEILERNTFAVVKYLLVCLTVEIEQAERSLLQAAVTHPMYGRVHCIIAGLQQLNLRSLVMVLQWRELVAELISVSYRMSAVVSPVVQSSSPEGLIPMDTEPESSASLQQILQEIQPRDGEDFSSEARLLEQEREGSPVDDNPSGGLRGRRGQPCQVTAQMVLVCCWRSMKEVSLLLGMVCESLPLQYTAETRDGLLTEQQVQGIGLYFRQQLLQSRHRGAFELAYVGFVKLTEMLTRCSIKNLQQLPQLWLWDVLDEVKSSDPSSKLCATRRSAGIPFYIQALLSSEPKASSCSLLKTTMTDLIALAMPSGELQTDASTVPQVHALNILRALFRDTRLSENIIPYVAEGAQAAILGFTSPVWAVRNSSTLLFSTVLTRIFGVKKGRDEHSKKNRMIGRELFSRFPALYPFLLRQLETVASTVDGDSGVLKLHPCLFLLLLILGRLYPSPMDGTSSTLSLAPFVPFIIRCGRSPVWRSREMAARALVPFVMVNQLPSTALALLRELPDRAEATVRHNHVHGTLLQVLHLLRAYLESKHRANSETQHELRDIITCVRARLWLATRLNPCVVTRAATLDILTCLCSAPGEKARDPDLASLQKEVLELVSDSELLQPDSLSVAELGVTQYLLSAARLALCVWQQTPSEALPARLLQSPVYEVRLLVLQAALDQLQSPTPLPPAPYISILSGAGSALQILALQETHPQCLAMVLKVLSHLSLDTLLPWTVNMLSDCELLRWIVCLAEDSIHSVEIHCAALRFASKLVVHWVECNCKELGGAMQPDLTRWVGLVAQCCEDEQPIEIKLTAAEILVSATPSVLTSTTLPLGLSGTLPLWRSLFTLLQDEDQEARDRAADFFGSVPSQLLVFGPAVW
ncbi:thyroid adenoma-associated protein-like isoform X2 [Polyodon spathula]|uniref:thyroid adenoma-associated protein-like isoform X2 n=1 Tax=Polyodon spathula TaxID=7913 RepID=UPI001B7EA1BD|nr:thyroid adenoma-associated protein-like isoform X2 [Polyodon spathula]